MNEVDRQEFGSGDPARGKARIKAMFVNRGVPIAMGNESEEARLDRIYYEITVNGRDPDAVRASIDAIAAGRTPQAPYTGAPAVAPQGPAPLDPFGVAREQGQRDALASIRTVLTRYGLPETLGTWAWDQIVGGRGEAEVMLELRERPEYKTRFKAIGEAERRGLPALSAAQIVEFENAAIAKLKAAGAPTGFFDSPDDFVDVLVNGWSAMEFEAAVDQAMVQVIQAPQEVKDYYRDAFGISGVDGLLALYLNPEKARPVIDRMAETAIIGGAGARFGANLGVSRADQIAALGVTGAQAQQGFMELDAKSALFDETLTEGTDLTLAGAGVDAAFGLGEGGARELERRRQARVAASAGSGGSVSTEKGVRGLGIAER